MLQSKPHCALPHVLPPRHPIEELAQVPPLDSDGAPACQHTLTECSAHFVSWLSSHLTSPLFMFFVISPAGMPVS